MKNVFTKILILIVCFASSAITYGQHGRNSPGVRIVLLKSQMDEVKRRIHIDDKNLSNFEKLYESYINEISQINNNNRIPSITDLNLEKYSENQVEAIFMQQSEKARKLLSVREKYFWLFRSILTPKDIIIMYRVEREVINRALQEIRNREQSKNN